jgi:single-stranded-DNA-specific exonuclease
MENWMVYNKKADFQGIGQRFGIDQVTARILRNRDLTDEADIRLFLEGGMADLYDPGLLKDADLLTDILIEKIKEHKPIRIIGDYDIDGVMASYILEKALLRCGANVSVQIPDRIADGYGLNQNLVTKAMEDGMDTILTCDNGIAAIEEIALAKSYGMTVLVTDHHAIPFEGEGEQRRELKSAADAVVNAHQKDCPYPNKELCGAAVAWKVVCLLYEKMGIGKDEAEIFLENVAFATVGDIMSLTGENRILVKEGLKRIRHTQNLGMRALIDACAIDPMRLDTYHFGYVLGPCINASGRLETAEKALLLFLAKTENEAQELAADLVLLNEERKEMTNAGVEQAKALWEQEGGNDPVIILYLPGVHESIAGIIAGRIRESYNKPTFILTDGADGIKGSGRSIEAYSMYEELCKCRQFLTKFGGHPMAAGLSMAKENLSAFRDAMNRNCTLTEEQMQPKIYIDVPMPLDYVNMDLVREFGVLAPFGKDNERPVFADKGIAISRMWIIGKNKNVLRLSLKTSSGRPAAGIYFGAVDDFCDYFRKQYGTEAVEAAFAGRDNPIVFSAVYQPSINSYRGEETLQFEIRYYR